MYQDFVFFCRFVLFLGFFFLKFFFSVNSLEKKGPTKKIKWKLVS